MIWILKILFLSLYYKIEVMSKIDFENIRPYYLRNLVMLINDGFISYDMITHKWVLLNGRDKDIKYFISYDSIDSKTIKMVVFENGSGKLYDYEGYLFSADAIIDEIVTDGFDLVNTLVKNNFHNINFYVPKYHCIDKGSNVPISLPMDSDRVYKLIQYHGTLLCPEGDESDIDVEATDNFLDMKFETTEEKDIDRFSKNYNTLPFATPNGSMISKEDQDKLDKISKKQEEINETYSEYIGRDIDFSPADGDTNTFVSEGDPFDVVIRYFIDKGILDRLEFNSGIYVTLKSHMVIGTDVFVEAGISELSLKNKIIKIKHMIGQEMHETKLELSFVFEKITSDDIYIRPFDMHKGKKIYTVKID